MHPIPDQDPQHCSGLCSGSGLNWISGFGSGQAKVVPLIKEKLRNFMLEIFKFVSSKWKKTFCIKSWLGSGFDSKLLLKCLREGTLSEDSLNESRVTLLSFKESSDEKA